MAKREEGNLPDARIEVRITADGQRGGPLLHGGRDRALDVAFGRGLEHDYLQPEAARGGLRLLDDILRDARIGWIHQYGNPPGAGKELVQQLQPLGNELDTEDSVPRDVPVRTSEARHETRSDRIGGRGEDNRNRLGRCHRRLDGDVRGGGEDDRNPAA